MNPNPIIPFYPQIEKYFVRSKGCFLYDAEKRKYIDFESGDWAACLGHSDRNISRIIRRQSRLLMNDGLRCRNVPSEKLSLKLLDLLSLEDGKCVFLNSGSEAVNLGITLAKKLTGRNKVLRIEGSYLTAFGHGRSDEDNKELVSIPLNDWDEIFKMDYSDIAVFVFEPGSAWGSIRIPFEDYALSVAYHVRHFGGMILINEVTTGFGRTGKWFGHQYYTIKADMVAMGKALGNGYPVSCLAISENISKMFNTSPFRYAQSHQNDPLGCAIGLEVIRIIEKKELVKRAFDMGNYLWHALEILQTNYPECITELRGRGLMLALQFHRNVNAAKIHNALFEDGFLLGEKENALRFMPPLTIQQEHIDKLIIKLESLIVREFQILKKEGRAIPEETIIF